MRVPIPLLLAMALALGACEDAIGPAGTCSSEKNALRRERGAPDQRFDELRNGDYREQWVYIDGSSPSGTVYTFRWGVSYDRCIVESGPLSASGLTARLVIPNR
jgi:hypothetical protein